MHFRFMVDGGSNPFSPPAPMVPLLAFLQLGPKGSDKIFPELLYTYHTAIVSLTLTAVKVRLFTNT